jgi:hypothetical protein
MGCARTIGSSSVAVEDGRRKRKYSGRISQICEMGCQLRRDGWSGGRMQSHPTADTLDCPAPDVTARFAAVATSASGVIHAGMLMTDRSRNRVPKFVTT